MAWLSFRYRVDCPLLVETVNSSFIFDFTFRQNHFITVGPTSSLANPLRLRRKEILLLRSSVSVHQQNEGTEQPNPLISRIASSKKKAPLQHYLPPPNHRSVYYPQAPRAEIISTVPTDPTRPEVAFVSFLRSQQPIRLNSERTCQQPTRQEASQKPTSLLRFPLLLQVYPSTWPRHCTFFSLLGRKLQYQSQPVPTFLTKHS